MTAYVFSLLLLGIMFLHICCSDNEGDEISKQGTVEITADWGDYSAEAQLPDDYTLFITGIGERNVDNRTATYQSALNVGTYDVVAYNKPANMTVNNLTASVALGEDGTLQQPGWFFSNARTKAVVVEPDKMVKTSIKMKQRVRQLTLTLVPQGGEPGQVAGEIEATLSGIASTFNLPTGELSEPKSIKPVFTKQLSTGAYSATIYIIGIAGNEQTLSLSLPLTGGRTCSLVSDMTEELRYFGNDISPLYLKAALELPEGAGTSGNIHTWEPEFTDGPDNVEIQ